MAVMESMVVAASVALLGGPGVETTKPLLPESWRGVWTGSSETLTEAGAGASFFTELTIESIEDEPDALRWRLVYGEGEARQTRDYRLRRDDGGRLVIDERNSIVVPMTMLEDGLYGQFRVMDSHLTTSYRLDGDELMFEIIVSRMDTESTTGGGQRNVPSVTTWGVQSVQRARLERVIEPASE